jgi:hypothetical protein
VNYDDTYDAAEPAGPTSPFPWPPAEGDSIIEAFGSTWRGAALEPKRFFGLMPADGSIGAALLYYLPLGLAVSAGGILWEVLRGGAGAERDAVLGAGDMPAISPLLQFLLAPLILLVSIILAAAVVHLLLKAFGGASRDLGFTVRLFAFAYSPQILGVVPVIGTTVGFVWMVVVAVIGLREGHGTTTGRAAAAVLIPVSLALIFMAVAAFIALTGQLLTP